MKQKILLVICILVGLLFLNGGLNKIFQYIPMGDVPKGMMTVFTAIMTIGWLMPLIAVVEIVGGILFMIPKFRALGAIVIFPIMVGILLTHTINDPSGMPMGIILMGINLWVIFEEREKYMPMIK